MKIEAFSGKVANFERKWEMTFDEFSHLIQDGTLDKDAYSWDVEQDFWEWEQSVTLLEHYQSLKQ